MIESGKYIVGRESEVEHFAALVAGHTPHRLLNVYGPGGIGKTILCQKLSDYSRNARFPIATVRGEQPNLTPDQLLRVIKDELSREERLAELFADFERQFTDHCVIQDILHHGGGVQELYDVVGTPKDPTRFEQLLINLGQPISTNVKQVVGNRFALERHLRQVEKSLATSLGASLSAALEKTQGPLALLLDTYEEMEGLDDWIYRIFVPILPQGATLVVFGRNALPKVNFDWYEVGDTLHTMALPELEEPHAKAYLAYHGLQDPVALTQVYQFTGGYPLLLVLVTHLAREAGGWQQIGTLESDADRDRVATKLLERILREERVHEVRNFLEKGVVARWFNPEIIRVLMEISPLEARQIYEKLQRHSFVERHDYGLKFHDKIRELLLERLKFGNPSEYHTLSDRLLAYFAEKAGLPASTSEEKRPVSQTDPGSSRPLVNIQIMQAQGVVVGDETQVSLTTHSPDPPQPPTSPTIKAGTVHSGLRRGDLSPFMVPPLPVQGVLGRADELSSIGALLAWDQPEVPNVPPVALLGLGGIGKTTLAMALGRTPEMPQYFPDGILWVEVGPHPTIRLLLERWGDALGLDLRSERDDQGCKERLQAALYHRRALLLIDDLWEVNHGQFFRIAGPLCRTLLTTRESPVAYDLATRDRTLRVDVLKPEAALELLCRLARDAVLADEVSAQRLCERLEFLPLALTLAGRLLAQEADIPSRMQRLVAELIERRETRLNMVQDEGRLGLDQQKPPSLQAILGMSIERLSETDQERFAMLAVFGGEPLTWEINAVSSLWDCSLRDAEDTVMRFIRRGLVTPQGARYWMHALLADYAQEMMYARGL